MKEYIYKKLNQILFRTVEENRIQKYEVDQKMMERTNINPLLQGVECKIRSLDKHSRSFGRFDRNKKL